MCRELDILRGEGDANEDEEREEDGMEHDGWNDCTCYRGGQGW